MDALEPNWQALSCFALAWTVCCFSFLVMTGFFPLSRRPAALNRTGGLAITLVNGGLLAAATTATIGFGYLELRWTSLVVVAGIIFLFVPALLDLWPEPRRDTRSGMALLLIGQVGVLAMMIAQLSPATTS